MFASLQSWGITPDWIELLNNTRHSQSESNDLDYYCGWVAKKLALFCRKGRLPLDTEKPLKHVKYEKKYLATVFCLLIEVLKTD